MSRFLQFLSLLLENPEKDLGTFQDLGVGILGLGDGAIILKRRNKLKLSLATHVM